MPKRTCPVIKIAGSHHHCTMTTNPVHRPTLLYQKSQSIARNNFPDHTLGLSCTKPTKPAGPTPVTNTLQLFGGRNAGPPV